MIPPQKIIRSYLLFAGLYTLSASVIWGVSTLFLLDAGLTLGQVFVVNAIFAGAMALFEIPTGVLADTRGRRTSLLLNVLVVFTGAGAVLWCQISGLRVGQLPGLAAAGRVAPP